jgi:probable F420-dependent oxidoreductase
MPTKPFRFALIASRLDQKQWRDTARQAEDLGYSVLVLPDGLRAPSPIPALALAAGATTTLHVGTWVLASPLRPPRLAAWDAHTLSDLSGGRFEFGIGTGRPDVADDAVNILGQPPLSPAQRLTQVGQAIDELRALDEERLSDGRARTPVLVAAGGPKSRALAAAKADIIAVAGADASREETAALVAEVRAGAGDRADGIEFAAPIFVVGDEAPPWVQQFLRTDMETMIARDSLRILRGSPREMADELLRRREEIGYSYFAINGAFTEQFAPVIELLA